MTRRTKAELEQRERDLCDAFDRLLASHKDCTSGYGFDLDWARQIERETELVRFGFLDMARQLQREKGPGE